MAISTSYGRLAAVLDKARQSAVGSRAPLLEQAYLANAIDELTLRHAQTPNQPASGKTVVLALEDTQIIAAMMKRYGAQVDMAQWAGQTVPTIFDDYVKARLAGHRVTLVLDYNLGDAAHGCNGVDVARAFRAIDERFGFSPAFIYPNSNDADSNRLMIEALAYQFVDASPMRQNKFGYFLAQTPAVAAPTPTLFGGNKPAAPDELTPVPAKRATPQPK